MNQTTLKINATGSLLVAGFALALSFLCGAATARGQLLFSDSFQYPNGSLVGDGPPADAPPGQSGWSALFKTPKVTARNLVYPGVFSIGNAVSVSGAAMQGAEAALTDVNTGVVWVSYLAQLVDGNTDDYAYLALGGTGPNVGLIDSGFYGIANQKSGVALTSVMPGPTPDWLVLKLDFDAGTEELLVNPELEGPGDEPGKSEGKATLRMSTTFKHDGFNALLFISGVRKGVFHLDEVRVGRTFNDVRKDK